MILSSEPVPWYNGSHMVDLAPGDLVYAKYTTFGWSYGTGNTTLPDGTLEVVIHVGDRRDRLWLLVPENWPLTTASDAWARVQAGSP